MVDAACAETVPLEAKSDDVNRTKPPHSLQVPSEKYPAFVSQTDSASDRKTSQSSITRGDRTPSLQDESKTVVKTREGSSSSVKKQTKGKTKPLHFWTSADFNKWFKKHGGHVYNLYGELLMKHDVTGRTLIRLNDIKLEHIGIINAEHRKELLHHILKLRLKHESVDLRNLDQKGSGFELKIPETRQTVDKEKKEKPP